MNAGTPVGEEVIEPETSKLWVNDVMLARRNCSCSVLSFFCDSEPSFLVFLVLLNAHQETPGLLHPAILPLQADTRVIQAPYEYQGL